jgi:hypothetical protein
MPGTRGAEDLGLRNTSGTVLLMEVPNSAEASMARKLQRIQFHKNMAMIGGLLFAALDEP